MSEAVLGSPSSAQRGRVKSGSLVLCVLAFFCVIPSFAQVAVPPLRGPVTDLTNTLTPAESSALDQKLRAFEQRKGSQIAVLLVPTTQPEAIEQYSIRVVEQWKLGRRGVDDGVLFLLAKDDRAVRIEVAYGLEGALPDVIANRIIQQVVVPRFRNGQFYEGIDAAVDRIVAVLDGEPLPEARARAPSDQGIGSALPVLLMFLFVGSGILRRMLGRFGGAAATAGIAGFVVWLLTSVAVISIGAAVIAFLFTLLGGGGGGPFGGFAGRRRHGGWGGGFGGGFGGGGGGGWSGGGGSFGGGGASGRW